MSARQQRATVLLVGAGFALVFALVAAVQVAAWSTGGVERTSSQVIPGPVERLEVHAGAGEILVVPSAGDAVRVDSTVSGNLHTPRVQAVKDGARVRVDGSCAAISFGACDARIVVHVPAATDVEVRTGAGDLTASGLNGRVRLATGSGDVHADALTGDVTLHTESGDVDGRALSGTATLRSASGDIELGDLTAARVEATTLSGDVDLAFGAAPEDVEATTASGDVSVDLPGTVSYAVSADTGSGDREVGVRTDPASPRSVRARTSSGDVSVATTG
jgi:hypothetical protein